MSADPVDEHEPFRAESAVMAELPSEIEAGEASSEGGLVGGEQLAGTGFEVEEDFAHRRRRR